ncbi:MAG: biotin--[Anaerolineaceae bacterium]|nr:biotin--[acetyl-CoA-carboxylase] ligase [Anaerolineaceae bacterium]
MRTKEKLLQILEKNKNNWISGEETAENLSISRAAIWKTVKSLRNDGYIIDAVRNKGYRLVSEVDEITELGIWKYLSPECRMLDIHLLTEVGSTNVLLRQKADEGYQEGTVLIASMQTDGRGRLGRRFYSPADTGIYMSLLLRPVTIQPEYALRLTTIAAAAAAETIELASGKIAAIKWVNDIYLDGKKVCGILTEGSVGMESGQIDSVIVGVGINVYEPEKGFPEEIKETAGAVFDKNIPDGKNILAAGFLNRFMRYYLSGDFDSYIAEYRKRCFILGKGISVIKQAQVKRGIAEDIDDDCRLIVRYDDGSVERLSGGEIKIN